MMQVSKAHRCGMHTVLLPLCHWFLECCTVLYRLGSAALPVEAARVWLNWCRLALPRYAADAQSCAAGVQPVGVFVDESAKEIASRCAEAGIQTAQLHGKAARRAVTQLHEDLHLIYVMNCQPDGRCMTPMPAMLAEEHEETLSRYTGCLPATFGIWQNCAFHSGSETLPKYACSLWQSFWPWQQPAQPRAKAAETECWPGQPATQVCLLPAAPGLETVPP